MFSKDIFAVGLAKLMKKKGKPKPERTENNLKILEEHGIKFCWRAIFTFHIILFLWNKKLVTAWQCF